MKKKRLKIYFTSDVHGYFYPTSYGDTLEKNMGLFQCAAEFCKDEDTLILDGGDILQGSAFDCYCRQTLQSSRVIAEIMNDCGYDYYTLGNHDFNYGAEYQAEYRNAHHGRCVCQNVTDTDGNVLYPYEIKRMPGGLRVGIVGIVTDYINVWEKAENLVGVRITEPVEAARDALHKMRGQVDLTVCIYHGGFEREVATGRVLSETTENAAYRICEELDFDILLTGHQHMSIDGQWLNGTYVVQPKEYAKEYHYLEIAVEDGKKEIYSKRCIPKITQQERGKSKETKEDLGKILRDKYSSVEQKVQIWLDETVGHLSRALVPEDKVKMALYGSPIADFLNRVQLHFSGAQLSAVGLANEMAGFRKEVSMRDIIATYPYPNTLVVCRITGGQLKTAMERSAEYFAVAEDGKIEVSKSFLEPKVEHYNYDYYAGVTYDIEPAKPIGNRIQNLCCQGKPVQENDTFTLCLNNYRHTGTGGYEVYRECEVIREINTEMVELIMEYFMQNSYIEV